MASRIIRAVNVGYGKLGRNKNANAQADAGDGNSGAGGKYLCLRQRRFPWFPRSRARRVEAWFETGQSNGPALPDIRRAPDGKRAATPAPPTKTRQRAGCFRSARSRRSGARSKDRKHLSRLLATISVCSRRRTSNSGHIAIPRIHSHRARTSAQSRSSHDKSPWLASELNLLQ